MVGTILRQENQLTLHLTDLRGAHEGPIIDPGVGLGPGSLGLGP